MGIPVEPSELDDQELDEPTFLRRPRRLEPVEPEPYAQLGEVRFRPLLWTLTPPRIPGWWYVRYPGHAEYEAVRVEAGFDYGPGLEWCGPLPQPSSC